MLKILFSVNKVQQVKYLPTQVDYKMILQPFSTFLDEMICVIVVECKLSWKQQVPNYEDSANNLIENYIKIRC